MFNNLMIAASEGVNVIEWFHCMHSTEELLSTLLVKHYIANRKFDQPQIYIAPWSERLDVGIVTVTTLLD